MLMKRKKNRKHLKITNFEKKKKMVWRYGGKGATHKVWHGSMQRFLRNLSLQTDGQMTDACAMTIALPTKSSRAKNTL